MLVKDLPRLREDLDGVVVVIYDGDKVRMYDKDTDDLVAVSETGKMSYPSYIVYSNSDKFAAVAQALEKYDTQLQKLTGWQSDWNGDEVGFDNIDVVGLYSVDGRDAYIDIINGVILEYM